MKNFESIRSINGRGRIMYAPEWSKSQPYVTYRDGTAGRHFSNLPSAMAYMGGLGYAFRGAK